MPAPKVFKYQVIAEVEKAIAAQNKMIAKHQQEVQVLKEKVRLGRQVDRTNRSAGRLASGFGSVLIKLQAASQLLHGMRAAMMDMQSIRIGAFEGLKKEVSTRTKLRQISDTIPEFEALIKLSDKVAQTQAISIEAAQRLVFENKSRGFTVKEIGAQKSIRGTTDDPRIAFNIAADLATAFGKEATGTVSQAVSGVLKAAQFSKVDFDILARLLLRPSQAAKGAGITIEETMAGIATVVGGVQDPTEGSTALRAAFNRLGKDPRTAAKIKRGGLNAALDYLSTLSREELKAFTPDVREQLGIGLLVENREKVARDLEAIKIARAAAGTGLSGDILAVKERILQADPLALGPLLAQRRRNAKEIAERNVSGVPGASIQGAKDVLGEAYAIAYGDAFEGKLRRVIDQAMLKAIELGPRGSPINVVETARMMISVLPFTSEDQKAAFERMNTSLDLIGDNLLNFLSEKERQAG